MLRPSSNHNQSRTMNSRLKTVLWVLWLSCVVGMLQIIFTAGMIWHRSQHYQPRQPCMADDEVRASNASACMHTCSQTTLPALGCHTSCWQPCQRGCESMHLQHSVASTAGTAYKRCPFVTHVRLHLATTHPIHSCTQHAFVSIMLTRRASGRSASFVAPPLGSCPLWSPGPLQPTHRQPGLQPTQSSAVPPAARTLPALWLTPSSCTHPAAVPRTRCTCFSSPRR